MNAADKDRVLRIVEERKNESIEFLRDLVRIPSVAVVGEERRCQEFVARKLQDSGFKTDIWETDWEEIKRAQGRDGKRLYIPVESWTSDYEGFKNRPNVVGVLDGAGNGRSILLNGHIDVVPVGPLQKWTHDPWGATLQDGRLYGRGAADMKAGLAAMIFAIECIKRAEIKLQGNVTLESVVDEETGGNGTLACLQKGYHADAGIFAEPTELGINFSHTGEQFFRITVDGKTVHIGNKNEGVNAIDKAMKIIRALDLWEDQRTRTGHRRFPEFRRYEAPFPIVCGGIRAGPETLPESPAESCVIEGAFQTMPTEEVQHANASLKRFVQKTASADAWMKKHPPKVEFYGPSFEGSRVKPTHPLIGILAKSTEEVLEHSPQISAFPTSCDMRLYTNHGDTPSLIFGPGSLRRSHFPDEYVEVGQYSSAIRVFALTIMKWCGTSS